MATSGIYEVQLQPHDGAPERRAFAVNVPVGEGDLQTVDREDLTGNWPASPIKCTTRRTWRSISSNWPASKWATRCWDADRRAAARAIVGVHGQLSRSTAARHGAMSFLPLANLLLAQADSAAGPGRLRILAAA